ncbi:MAG: right-handed parallel beta-helix repeat-containing protein, partial [Nanoarchaeota archaeon]
MSKIVILFALCLMLCSYSTLAAVVSCGDVLTSNTVMENDLSDCPGDGLILNASSITLDCDGYNINGTFIGNGVKVMDGLSSIEIMHCAITDFEKGIYFYPNTSGSEVSSTSIHDMVTQGIFLQDAIETLFFNVTVSNVNESGIYILDNSLSNHIVSSFITNSKREGISILNSNTTQINNTIIRNSGLGGSYDGILIDGGSHNVIANSNVSNASQHGVSVIGGEFNQVSNSAIVWSAENGIDAFETSNLSLTNVSISDNEGRGFSCDSCNNVTLINVSLFDNQGPYAAYYVSSNIITFDNCQVGDSATLVRLLNSPHAYFTHSDFSNSDKGIYATSNNNSLISNSRFYNVTNATVLMNSNATIKQNEFVNVSSAAYLSGSVGSIMIENVLPRRYDWSVPYVSVIQSPFFVFSNNTLAGGWVSGKVFPEIGIGIMDSNYLVAENNSFINLSTVFFLNGSHWCKLIFNHIDSGGLVSADASSGLNVSGNRFFGALNVSNSMNVTFADNEGGKTVYTYDHDSLVRFDNVAGAL